MEQKVDLLLGEPQHERTGALGGSERSDQHFCLPAGHLLGTWAATDRVQGHGHPWGTGGMGTCGGQGAWTPVGDREQGAWAARDKGEGTGGMGSRGGQGTGGEAPQQSAISPGQQCQGGSGVGGTAPRLIADTISLKQELLRAAECSAQTSAARGPDRKRLRKY